MKQFKHTCKTGLFKKIFFSLMKAHVQRQYQARIQRRFSKITWPYLFQSTMNHNFHLFNYNLLLCDNMVQTTRVYLLSGKKNLL